MTHPHFDRVLAELRSYHRDPERREDPAGLARRAGDLGLAPGPAQLLLLHLHCDRLWRTVRSEDPSGSEPSLRSHLLEIAHEALWILLLLEDPSISHRCAPADPSSPS